MIIAKQVFCRKCREAPCGSPGQKHIKICIPVQETHKGPPYITFIRLVTKLNFHQFHKVHDLLIEWNNKQDNPAIQNPANFFLKSFQIKHQPMKADL
jgi:hypothetical protein